VTHNNNTFVRLRTYARTLRAIVESSHLLVNIKIFRLSSRFWYLATGSLLMEREFGIPMLADIGVSVECRAC
jgi:hypothetical protein